jgi:hypothetical protein
VKKAKNTKWTQNIPASYTASPSKMYPNLYCWFENVPSGNPDPFTILQSLGGRTSRQK